MSVNTLCLTPFVLDGSCHSLRTADAVLLGMSCSIQNYGSLGPRALRNCLARPAPRFYSARYIGSFDFVVRVSEVPIDPEEARRRRVDALTRWLIAQWRAERKEGTN